MAKELRNKNIILHEPVIGHSGKMLDYYVNVKEAYGDPRTLSMIGDCLMERIGAEITCAAARGYGGVPLLPVVGEKALALGRELKLTYIRDMLKGHGIRNMIDGYKPSEKDGIVILDDVITTGSNLQETKKILEETVAPQKANVVKAIVVIRRSDVRINIPVEHILTVDELLQK